MKRTYEVRDRADKRAIREFLKREGQFLLPMLELVEQTEVAIAEVIQVMGRATIEAVLEMSAEGMGFLYDSSLMSDDQPYELMADGQPTGMVELPVEWILDDAPLLNPRGNSYSAPREVLQVYVDEFDRAYDEGTMFLLTMHPHYIGHRSRIVILEGLIDHINEQGDVWYATHRQIAEYVSAQAGLAQ